MRYENNDIYEGDWEFGVKKGKGKYNFADGSFYDGDFDNDEKHGKGIIKYIN